MNEGTSDAIEMKQALFRNARHPNLRVGIGGAEYLPDALFHYAYERGSMILGGTLLSVSRKSIANIYSGEGQGNRVNE